jgi:DNA-binding GntR family transcriptional regulator
VVRAVEKAYQTVRDAIIEGRYPAAARITEQEVAQAAGVSRTPVREALRRLHAEGLVDFAPNQGAVVTTWTEADSEDIFDLRAMLEAYGAQRAARRASAEQVAELRDLAERQYAECTRREEGYLQRIGDLNSQFHRRVQEAADSPRLTTALSALIEAPLIMRTFEKYTPDDLVRSAAHHLELVRAIEARDGDWAASVMRSHILAARGTMRR